MLNAFRCRYIVRGRCGKASVLSYLAPAVVEVLVVIVPGGARAAIELHDDSGSDTSHWKVGKEVPITSVFALPRTTCFVWPCADGKTLISTTQPLPTKPFWTYQCIFWLRDEMLRLLVDLVHDCVQGPFHLLQQRGGDIAKSL